MLIIYFILFFRIKQVTQKRISGYIKKDKVTRVGATIDPPRRAAEYRRDGLKGQMNFAKTKDMKKAEQRLLDQCGKKYTEVK